MRTTQRLPAFLAGMALFGAACWSIADESLSADSNITLEPIPAVHQDEISIQEASATLGGKSDCDCGKSDKGKCSCEKMQSLEKAAAGAYKGLFYDNDFSYLCDPCYDGWHLGEALKRNRIGDHIIMDVGGQYRARFQSEHHMRNGAPYGLGLSPYSDDFLLQRTRLYMNAEIGDRVRIYAEMLDAVSDHEKFAPRPIEENRTELQNLFIDALLLDNCNGDLVARLGRQEVALGSQRLVSPLDWANTRRTFDGARLMWEGQNWDIDGLWLRPMQIDKNGFDTPDQDKQLYGMYSTYKGLDSAKLDLYWLAYDAYNGANRAAAFRYDTLGLRLNGSRGQWLYDFEGDYQFGTNADDTDHSAGAITLGGGRKLGCSSWKPTMWLYYDWASGDDTLNNGYHHYEPLAHKYNGFMDFYGRRNLEDYNVLFTMQPHKKLQLLAWYHYFRLQDGDDAPYTVVMTPYQNLAAGTGDRDLGHEIDLIATMQLTARAQLLFGYSHFFAGSFYDNPDLAPTPENADFFYTEFTLNF